MSDQVMQSAQSNPLVEFSEQAFDWLMVGGPVVWILLTLSVVAATITLSKIALFVWVRPETTRSSDRALTAWSQGAAESAHQHLSHRHPLDQLISHGIKRFGELSKDELSEELVRRATQRLAQLRQGLKPLEMIGTISPLLGLLGTVLGMIEAFRQMEQAGAQIDPSVLSGGIWQALLTTAVGMSVALPVVVTHAWLERKVERVEAVWSDALTRLFTQGPRLGDGE